MRIAGVGNTEVLHSIRAPLLQTASLLPTTTLPAISSCQNFACNKLFSYGDTLSVHRAADDSRCEGLDAPSGRFCAEELQLVDEADFQQLGLGDAPRGVHILLRGLGQEQEGQL